MQDALGRIFTPFVPVLLVPFKGNGLKAVLTGRFFKFPLFGRVDVVDNVLSGCRGAFPCFFPVIRSGIVPEKSAFPFCESCI
jgi:hypothetical protein